MTSPRDVIVTHLELDLTAGVPSQTGSSPLDLRREPADAAPAVAAAMYLAVGGPWHWTDRLPWSAAEWVEQINRNDVEVWVARVDGDAAGYFELHATGDAVELRYFGLKPEFTGQRLGGVLLAAAIARASALGRPRVIVNTCTLDHPAALPNYLRRGFVVVRTETRHPAVPA